MKNACGIRIPPNLARILERWGIGKEFKDKAILCKKLTFRKRKVISILRGEAGFDTFFSLHRGNSWTPRVQGRSYEGLGS